jgi:hypothetical protein
MAQPNSTTIYYYSPQPAPPSSTPSLTPNTQPLSSKPAVTSDAYCLYTTQGEVICNKKGEKITIAPWGSEKKYN